MTRDEVMRETLKHVRRVGELLMIVCRELQYRAVVHDDSKFSDAEFESFARETPALRGMTYGSNEYKAAIARLGPALAHHYEHNDHHPEHFKGGVHEMDLVQVIEMLADWKAATERHATGSLVKSIKGNAARFGYGRDFEMLLARTALRFSWISADEFSQLFPV